VPWEKLRRTTFTPAVIMRASISSLVEDGPNVATIFVLRNVNVFTFIIAFWRMNNALQRKFCFYRITLLHFFMALKTKWG